MSRISVIFFLFFCIICIGACMKKTPPPEVTPVDTADTALSRAAEEIQKDLLMLSQNKYQQQNAPTGNLGTLTQYRFTGELEDLTRDVAKNIGYKTEFKGKVPIQPVIISIYSTTPIPWFNILEMAGVQAGARANLIIDDSKKAIIVEYLKEDEIFKNDKSERQNTSKSAKQSESSLPTKAQASRKLSLPNSEEATTALSDLSASKDTKKSRNLLMYKGDLSGAHKEMAKKMGYKPVVIGQKTDIDVSISSGDRTWGEIVSLINSSTNEASIVVDDVNERVVLRYAK